LFYWSYKVTKILRCPKMGVEEMLKENGGTGHVGATGGLFASIPETELLRRTVQGISAAIPGAL
jgi:hypothetical protein